MAKVKIETSLGNIIVRLYDETPIHRDNFLKLANDGFYNGTLFHRVIKNFMIQGGDPESKGAPAGKQLGSGDAGYTLPAEIKPGLFHKRGALAAARLGDEVNPKRDSSGCQFYIVWGEVMNAGKLAQMDKQMQMQAEQSYFNSLVQQHKAEILQLRKNRDQQGLIALQDHLIAETKAYCKENPAQGLTAEQKEVYSTIGGTPFLDGQYTVFGEVEEGLDIVEQIQNVATARGDRPKEDISMTVSVIE